MNDWTRRKFLHATAGATFAAASGCLTPAAGGSEVIDCHTHFYDPTRPQGVPWPGRSETLLYRRVLPADYMKLARPIGITGTVVVEASEWLADNDWILDLAAREPFIRGFVGNVKPGTDNFSTDVRRLARNGLFRGIRARDIDAARLEDAAIRRDFLTLAEHNLTLDLNGGPSLLPAVARLADAIPNLRVIIDHISNVKIDGRKPPSNWIDGMQALSGRPNVFCKLSGLVEGSGRQRNAPMEIDFYRPVLDHVWSCFGEERLVYGSNWPVSELFADLPTVHSIVTTYLAEKGKAARSKIFSQNSHRFYALPMAARAV